MNKDRAPAISLILSNQQRELAVPMRWLRGVAKAALPLALKQARSTESTLGSLRNLEITVVDDACISRVHGEFLGDSSTTDVITFEHGEILINAPCARREAEGRSHGAIEELALYLVHGMMHLGGWDDPDPAQAAAMAKAQDEVWRQALSRSGPPPQH